MEAWCQRIEESNFTEAKGDFEFDGLLYRPNDLFRVKVRGMFPEVAEDTLIPLEWIDLAQERWKRARKPVTPVRIGADVAGMGRDNSIFCHRMDPLSRNLK